MNARRLWGQRVARKSRDEPNGEPSVPGAPVRDVPFNSSAERFRQDWSLVGEIKAPGLDGFPFSDATLCPQRRLAFNLIPAGVLEAVFFPAV